MRFFSIFLTLTLLAQAPLPAGAREDTALAAQLRPAIAAHKGTVALFAQDLKTGRTLAINADMPMPTASVIKLAVLFDAVKQVQEGSAHFEDRLTMTSADPVEGSGVLQFFDRPLTITLKDALTMMVIVSDNTGTNLVIDHLGLARIDQRIQWLGLKNTWLYKKVFKPAIPPVPADQPTYGLGKTTAREMAEIMRRFAVCDLNAPGQSAPPTPAEQKLCDVAVGMLKNQTDRQSIPRYLTVDTANKTGSLDEVRNDVAIAYAKNGPIVISAFTANNQDHSWTPDNSAQLLMARLAKTIVDRWQ